MTLRLFSKRSPDFEKPFIYICSLRRTGSTVVSELLTLIPHSFIFREPRLAEGRFATKPHDVDLFRTHDIDLSMFAERWNKKAGNSFVRPFRNELLPKLQHICRQLGVKEIRNKGWRQYVQSFPQLHIILTGRDPRDIYLSLHSRIEAGKSSWRGDFTPETLASNLSEEFDYQLAASESAASLKVRYEDLCTDPATIVRIKQFVQSDIPTTGTVGAFNASNPNRRAEFDLHGSDVTAKRVRRWKNESDESLRDAALRTFQLMPAYCKYWGYEIDASTESDSA